MRVTIIKDDNVVIVDGKRHTVDCSGADFHALQWYDLRGEIEYGVTRCETCGHRHKKPNEAISDLTPYGGYLDGWKRAAAEEAERKELEASIAADRATAEVTNAAGPQS